MKINNCFYNINNNQRLKKENSTSFQSAYVNVVSMADNHGILTTLPNVFETVLKNFDGIFPDCNKIIFQYRRLYEKFQSHQKANILTSLYL